MTETPICDAVERDLELDLAELLLPQPRPAAPAQDAERRSTT